MIYSIQWKPKALKFLNNLPKTIALRIWNKLDEIRTDPFRYLKHFESKNIYKIRIGDYRLLIDINTMTNILTIQVFDKRGRVYKR